MSGLTPYDRRALEELYGWKHPTATRRARAADRAERLLDEIAERLPLGLVDEVVKRLMPVVNQGVGATVSPEMILWRYRQQGHTDVRTASDISLLTLEDAERVVGKKRLREAVRGAGQGAATGWYGALGIPADIAALTALALRCSAVFAYSYGFDASTKAERARALAVLNHTSSFGPKAKRASLASLDKLAADLAGRQGARQAAARLLQRLPRVLAVRMTVLSTDNAVPGIGALTSGGFNAWFLRSVAVNARFEYRERFLERRYGPDLLDAYGL